MTTSKTQDETGVDKRNERDEIVKARSTRLQQATVALIKASNALPKMGDGFELYSTYPLYYKCTRDQRIRIATAMKNLLSNSGCKVRIPVEGPDDMDKIIFVNDLLVERASMALDEHQKRLAQNYAAKRLSCGAEPVPGSVATPSRVVEPALSDAMPKIQGFQDGLGRYAQLSRRSEETAKVSADPIHDLSITQGMEEFNTDGYLDLLHSGSCFNNRQLAALAKLWKWRFVTARKNSKSVHYILPDHMMLRLAEVLPRDMQGITAACHPLPPFVQHDLPLLHKMISTARELKLDANTGAMPEGMVTPKMQGVPQLGAANSSFRFSIGEQLDRIATTKKIDCVRKRKHPDGSLIIAQSLARAKSTASVTVLEECSKDEENSRETKLDQIYSTISQWSTPYESYLLAKRMDEDGQKCDQENSA